MIRVCKNSHIAICDDYLLAKMTCPSILIISIYAMGHDARNHDRMHYISRNRGWRKPRGNGVLNDSLHVLGNKGRAVYGRVWLRSHIRRRRTHKTYCHKVIRRCTRQLVDEILADTK